LYVAFLHDTPRAAARNGHTFYLVFVTTPYALALRSDDRVCACTHRKHFKISTVSTGAPGAGKLQLGACCGISVVVVPR
jgi:hypothetical protein